MGLADIVASAVSIARTVTLDLQPTITLQQWTGEDSFGKKTYATAQSLRAIVEEKQKSFKTDQGQDAVSKTYIAVLEPIDAATASAGYTRKNPVDERDLITLPDGTTGPILDVDGLVNGATGVPFYSQIYLGRSEQATGV